jgi:hypothetical protein
MRLHPSITLNILKSSTEIPNHYLEELILNKNMAGCSKVMSNTVVDLETTYSFLIIQEKVAGG